MKERAELDDLASQAEAAEGEALPAAGGVSVAPVGPPPPDPNEGPIAFLMAGTREVLCAVLRVESPRTTLADDKCEAIARVLAPVATKHGVRLDAVIEGPEAAAIMTAGPLLWTAYRELVKELEAKAKRQARPAPDGQADAEA